jgi:hypothetical protein
VHLEPTQQSRRPGLYADGYIASQPVDEGSSMRKASYALGKQGGALAADDGFLTHPTANSKDADLRL